MGWPCSASNAGASTCSVPRVLLEGPWRPICAMPHFTPCCTNTGRAVLPVQCPAPAWGCRTTEAAEVELAVLLPQPPRSLGGQAGELAPCLECPAAFFLQERCCFCPTWALVEGEEEAQSSCRPEKLLTSAGRPEHVQPSAPGRGVCGSPRKAWALIPTHSGAPIWSHVSPRFTSLGSGTTGFLKISL